MKEAIADAREMIDRAEENLSAVTILFKFRYSYTCYVHVE